MFLRIDNDVGQWFKNQGKNYQSLINAVLHSYFEHQSKIKNDRYKVRAKYRHSSFL
ncbi:MAG: BrnA antitoxin family protein [Waterburya sp.]